MKKTYGEKKMGGKTEENERKKRGKDAEIGDKLEVGEKVKRRKEITSDKRGLDPANKINYPSLAVSRAAAGKYDALGT